MLLLAWMVAAHLGDGAGREPFLVDGALVGGGTAVGLVLADDGAWRRACEEASGGAPLGYFRANDGRVLAATLNGLVATTDFGCSWAPVDGVLRNLEVASIARARLAPDVVYLSTSKPGMPNGVWKSDDGGATFAETALAGVIHPLLDVAVSSDGETVVVTGADLDEAAPLLQVSANGGASFTAPTDPAFHASDWLRVRALFVDDVDDATEPRVWLGLLDTAEQPWLGWAPLDLSLVHVEQALTTDALAMTALGDERLLLARGALYRRTTDTFVIVPGVELACLRANADFSALWACGAPGSGAQFLTSTDGVAWSVALADDQLVARACAEGTAAAQLCPVGVDAGSADAPDAGAVDAGTSDAGTSDAGASDAGGGVDDADAEHPSGNDVGGGGCASGDVPDLLALLSLLALGRARLLTRPLSG